MGSPLIRTLPSPRATRSHQPAPMAMAVHPASFEPRHGTLRVHGVDLHWAEVGAGAGAHARAPARALRLAPDLVSGRAFPRPVPARADARSRRPRRIVAARRAVHARLARERRRGLARGARPRSVDLVGHSFGGGVAQWMLLQHGGRIRRLGLEGGLGGLGREVGDMAAVGVPFRSSSSAPGSLLMVMQDGALALPRPAAGGAFSGRGDRARSRRYCCPPGHRARVLSERP